MRKNGKEQKTEKAEKHEKWKKRKKHEKHESEVTPNGPLLTPLSITVVLHCDLTRQFLEKMMER